MGRVLFLDDQEEILELLKRMLKDEEFKCFFAKDKDEALLILEENDIDVVVSDMIMPVMNGLEFLDIVRQRYPNVVRIILSGYSQVATILEAINTGQVYRFLTKPWKLDEKARQIIKDSIEYSRLLKIKDDDMIKIKYKNLIYLLEDIVSEYVLVKNKTDIMEMKLYNITIDYDDIDLNYLLENGFNRYEIDSNIEIYLKKE